MSTLLSFIPWDWVIGAIGALGLWFLGRRQGAQGEKLKRAEGTKDSLKKQRKDLEDASSLDDTSLADRISR